MFELKYTVTDADFRAENKRITLFYFLLYALVAAAGLAAGITATALRPQQLIFVLGIVLIVLSAVLALCALFIMLAPKNFVKNATDPSAGELNVLVDKHGITVNGNNLCPFVDITRIKRRKDYLLVYVGKDEAFMIKNTLGEKFDELVSYMNERKGRILLTDGNDEKASIATDKSATVVADKQNTTTENAAEVGESEGAGKAE